jgi:hypothetical protein
MKLLTVAVPTKILHKAASFNFNTGIPARSFIT